ncbi:MAG TPA: TraR/DksA C4-type zinc finger protein [Acidimicrobiales bacterium]|nr:TraR/DksA C4-type zinc finger protein [Acidimicrobiales bacterium]
MPDQRETDLSQRFVEERDHLRHQLAELEAGSAESLDFDDGFADSGQVAAEQGEAQALAHSLRDQIRDLDAAIAAIAEGSYGRCEVCGGEIGEARLEAMPATRRCIAHA